VYLAIILTIDIAFTILSWEVYANYIYLAITGLFLGRYKAVGYLKGFSIALTILTCFQWIVVFTGSLAFLALPHDWLVNNALYLMMLYSTHLAVAFLLFKFRHVVFKLDAGRELLFIDIGAKMFFIAFFNLIFPNYFETLGMVNYATLALVLLLTALIFTIYREYSVSLEKKLAVYNSNQLIVLQQAMQTVAKHERSSLHEANTIESPVVQALLYELVATGDRFGISIEISIDGNIENINLSHHELHTILSGFIGNALDEVQKHNGEAIFITICCTEGIFKFAIHVMTDHENNHEANYRLEKDTAINRMEQNGNITISISRATGFTQVLRVMC